MGRPALPDVLDGEGIGEIGDWRLEIGDTPNLPISNL